jgi:hypothetical protein
LARGAEAVHRSRLVIERLVAPQPGEKFRQAAPGDYQRLKNQPIFLSVRARRD